MSLKRSIVQRTDCWHPRIAYEVREGKDRDGKKNTRDKPFTCFIIPGLGRSPKVSI